MQTLYYFQMNATGPYIDWNGLVPPGSKPLPKPVFTKTNDAVSPVYNELMLLCKVINLSL